MPLDRDAARKIAEWAIGPHGSTEEATLGTFLLAALDELDTTRQALAEIAAEGCEKSTTGWCGDNPSLNFSHPYGADRVCIPCHARAALGISEKPA